MNSKTLFYVLKRIGLAILTIWVVITITFFVMHAVPGGPFVGEKATTPAVQAAMEAKYGLDKPVLEQYFTYLGDIVLRFDFGPSLKQRGRQVIDIIADGMKAGDKILIMPGDNSSVPTMRNDGFFSVLKENGWTEEQIAANQSTDYTGWSRSKGKELFIRRLDASTLEDITATKWIFTHDDEIAMGILEALKSSEIDAEKKDAFLNAGVHLGTSSGLNEIYSVLKGIHQKDYTAEVAKLADLFSVTYDPAMIKAAVDDMVTHIEGGTVTQDHVIAVSVVDATNVNDFQGFGDAVSK